MRDLNAGIAYRIRAYPAHLISFRPEAVGRHQQSAQFLVTFLDLFAF